MDPIPEENSHSSGETLGYVSLDSQGENGNQRKRKRASDWSLVCPQNKDRLYYKIFNCSSIEMAVQSWIDSYEIRKTTGIVELMQLFIDVSNYQCFNISEYLENNYLDEIVHNMEALPNPAYKDTGKYLLKLRSRVHKRHHSLIGNFIVKAILACYSNDILSDNTMVMYSTTILKLMSISKYRSIRHTGVFIGLKYMTAIVILIRNTYDEGLQIKRKIIEAQNASKDTTNLEIENIDLKHIHKFLNKVLHFLHSNVFNKNWNLPDKMLATMRVDCILEVRHWIKHLPEKFLQNDILSVVMQAVIDDNKDVRHAALKVFMSVFDGEEYKAYNQLKLNLQKYIAVICGRIADKDISVAAEAIDILCVIDKYHKKISREMGDRVLRQIFSPYYMLATAAGRLLIQKVTAYSVNDVELLGNLIRYQIHAEHNFHIGTGRRGLLIESIINIAPVLCDIDTYAYLLTHGEMGRMERDILADFLCESLIILTTGSCSLRREKSLKRQVNHEKVNRILNDVLSEIKTFSKYFHTSKFKIIINILFTNNIRGGNNSEVQETMSE